MKDPVGELHQELDRVHALPVQMARVEEEAKLLPAVQLVQGHLGAVEIEGDLAWVNLKSEAHAAVAAGIEDRVPAAGKVFEGIGDLSNRWSRPAGHIRPYRRAGEPGHDACAHLL